MRSSVAGVETVAKAAGHRRAAAELGRWRRDRCEGSGMKIFWTPKQGDQVRIISDALKYVKGSHIGNLK